MAVFWSSPLVAHDDKHAVVKSIYDCDTITVVIGLGLNVMIETPIRVFGVAAPEVRGREKRLGLACREKAIRKWISIGDRITVNVLNKDKYGRWVAEVTLPNGEDLATKLIAGGWAMPWLGKGQSPTWNFEEGYPIK